MIYGNIYLHIPIDFETLEPNSFEQNFEFIKQGTIEKLGISSSEYNIAFEYLEYDLAKRFKRGTKLPQLLELFKKTGNSTLLSIADDAEKKLVYLKEKYFK